MFTYFIKSNPDFEKTSGDLMALSFIIKFAKLVMNKRGSCGSLNLSKLRSKNKQVCKNAVTRLHGSCVLRVMGS